MSKKKGPVIEFRSYELPPNLPIVILTGDEWIISDKPSGRLHFHNCLDLGLCEENSGVMEFSDSCFKFSKGDVTVIGCDICHTTYSTLDHLSKWSYIFIDFEALLESFFPLKLFTNIGDYEDLVHGSCIKIPYDTCPDIRHLIKGIISAFEQKAPNYQYSIRGLSLSLLIDLLNYKNSSDIKAIDSPKSKKNSLVIAPALNYVQDHYDEDFPINTLSDLCGLSPTHFRRVFTQIMGESPLDYIINVKITKATSLLRTTNMSILQISENVGFATISSFNRHFKNLMGSSPLKWRQENMPLKQGDIIKYTGWLIPPSDDE
ncbi:MAG: AraC family transcriptional regulator [Eubacterium sp.]|nr:AraC family transcriptional regulator [Eubacterium sp.]